MSQGIFTDKLFTESRCFEFSNAIIKAQDADIPLFGILDKFGITDFYSSPILSYDVMGDGSFFSLKQLEGFLGMNIVESVVPFDISRPLTEEEKIDVEKYNRADLLRHTRKVQTKKKYIQDKNVTGKRVWITT